jgi:hypothetical protein
LRDSFNIDFGKPWNHIVIPQSPPSLFLILLRI